MNTTRHVGRGRNREVRREGRAQASEVLRAIQRAFPTARATRLELLDERGERVSLAAELLPTIKVG